MYSNDVKEVLKEFIKQLHKSLYQDQSHHNIIDNKAKELFGEELLK